MLGRRRTEVMAYWIILGLTYWLGGVLTCAMAVRKHIETFHYSADELAKGHTDREYPRCGCTGLLSEHEKAWRLFDCHKDKSHWRRLFLLFLFYPVILPFWA